MVTTELRLQSTLLSFLLCALVIVLFLRMCLELLKDIRVTTGPSCSKLTMSLLNESLKILIIKYGLYANILLKKCE